MTEPRQRITKEWTEAGLEVSVEPILKKQIRATWIGDDGVRHYGHSTVEELRGVSNLPEDYRPMWTRPNSWVQQDKEGPFVAHQIRATFLPPDPGEKHAKEILDKIAERSPVVTRLDPIPSEDGARRLLELSIMDAHFGLACMAPGSDLSYDLEIARRLYIGTLRKLINLARKMGDFEKIVLPFGNDYLHADIVARGDHATSGGTCQPEMLAWHSTYIFAEQTILSAIEELSAFCPVHIPIVPGNHDRFSAFTLGRIINAYFHNNENVTVDASPSPYKFVEFGKNLIGYEHGHSVPPIRLAALMANECAEAWGRTEYREWHLGDQHRKGSSKTSAFEEQGVSIEYLPSIVAPNEWHRMKSFNRQKRGAMAFLWNYDEGPEVRVGVNLLGEYARRNAVDLGWEPINYAELDKVPE
jgi:hypothetical protein